MRMEGRKYKVCATFIWALLVITPLLLYSNCGPNGPLTGNPPQAGMGGIAVSCQAVVAFGAGGYGFPDCITPPQDVECTYPAGPNCAGFRILNNESCQEVTSLHCVQRLRSDGSEIALGRSFDALDDEGKLKVRTACPFGVASLFAARICSSLPNSSLEKCMETADFITAVNTYVNDFVSGQTPYALLSHDDFGRLDSTAPEILGTQRFFVGGGFGGYCYPDKTEAELGLSGRWMAYGLVLSGDGAGGTVEIEPARSQLVVSLGNESTLTTVHGTVVGNKRDCHGSGALQQCTFDIMNLTLTFEPFSFSDGGVDHLTIQSEQPASGLTQGPLVVITPSTFKALAQFKLSGVDGERLLQINQGTTIYGTWDPDNNNAEVQLEFQADTFVIHGTIGARFVNRSPRAVPGPEQSIECPGPDPIVAVLDGRASFDPDSGQHLGFFWGGASDGTTIEPPFLGTTPVVMTPPLGLGRHEFSLRVKDPFAFADTATTAVSLVDTTPPTLAASLHPDCLWPPNHMYVSYRLFENVMATATDVCAGDVTNRIRIANVTSSEGETGPGDQTARDVVFNSRSFCVRAERSDGVAQRVYAVTLAVDDGHGNTTSRVLHISVPHSAADQTCPALPPQAFSNVCTLSSP